MTIVVAARGLYGVVIGRDVVAVDRAGNYSDVGPKWVTAPSFAIGCAGEFGIQRLIRAGKTVLAKALKRGVDDFCDTLYHQLKINGVDLKPDEGRALPNCRQWFLLTDGREIWTIDPSFGPSLAEDGYMAIGSGHCHAMGALYAMRDYRERDTENVVRCALAAAERFDDGCRGTWIDRFRGENACTET